MPLLKVVRSYSIRTRISLGLILVVAIFIPITAASLYYVNELFANIERAAYHANVARAAEDVEVAIVRLRQLEKSFLLAPGVEPQRAHADQLNKVRQMLADLRRRVRQEDARDLDDLNDRLTLYESTAGVLFARARQYETSLTASAKQRVLEFRRRLDELLKEARRQERRGRSRVGSPTNASPSDPYQQIVDSMETFEKFILSVRERQDPEMTQLVTNLRHISDRMIRSAETVAARHWELLEESRRRAELLRARARRNVITGLMITLLAAAVLLITLPNRIVAPVQRLTGMAQRIRRGEVVAVGEIRLADEVGQLAEALDELVKHFHRLDRTKSAKIAERTRAVQILIDQLSTPAVIVDAAGEIHQWNEAFRNLVAPAAASLAGRSIYDLLGLPPEETAEFRERLQVGARRHWSIHARPGSEKPLELEVEAVPTTEEIHPARIILFFQPRTKG
ncbi:MAG: HAMP domain-containing protein [Acidobacteria bacterium]|nr:MAG: HAMP domain-containing protein [Acidobacteriota bacterium]